MGVDLGHEHHYKNKHLAEKAENWIGIAMVAVIVVLGAFLVYAVITTGQGAPSWMR